MVSRFDRFITERIRMEKTGKGATMAGQDEPNFDLFGSFGLGEFLEYELLTATDYVTEQTKTAETGGVATITVQTEQTESRQLNDEDIDNFIAENRNRNKNTQKKNRKVTLTCFTDGHKLLTKRELLKTYQNKNWTKF